MAGSFSTSIGSFLRTTRTFSASEIESLNVNAPEFKRFLIELSESLNEIFLQANTKDWGYYDVTEQVNGQTWFPNPSLNSTSSTTPVRRQVYRKVINFGALPNSTSKAVAHGIDIAAYGSNVTFTRIYGCGSNPSTQFVGIPDAKSTIVVDTTNITITTTANYSAYTTCYVVLEYITS